MTRACESGCWPMWYGGRWVVVEPITQYAHRYWHGRRSSDFHVMPTALFVASELDAHAATVATINAVGVRKSVRPERRKTVAPAV